MEKFLEAFRELVSERGELADVKIFNEISSKDLETSVCNCGIYCDYLVNGEIPVSAVQVRVYYTFPSYLNSNSISDDILTLTEKEFMKSLVSWYHCKYIPFKEGKIGMDDLYLGPREEI